MASSSLAPSISRSLARACRFSHTSSTGSTGSTGTCSSLRSSTRPSAFRSPYSVSNSTITYRTSSCRPFSTTPLRLKTIQQIRTRAATGPFSWKAGALFLLTGVGMIVYFQYEKARLERKRIVEMSKGVGKPKVGGPFVLSDLDGNVFTEEDLKGKYNFVYFGFTHCPDICPDELDKMAQIIDQVRAKFNGDEVMRPVFITCDPARDSPEVLRKYLSEFHKDIIGLTGTYEQVQNVCKQYRVYFSTPKDIKPGEDYLVDHSIYFYLMDPEGDFVECIGRENTAESGAKVIANHITDWKKEGKPLDTSRGS